MFSDSFGGKKAVKKLMNLKEFTKTQREFTPSAIRIFSRRWKEARKTDPESFPENMSESFWCESFWRFFYDDKIEGVS